jgi:phage gp29-like protein
MKTKSILPRLKSDRSAFRPIKSMTPDGLAQILDAFHKGELRRAALLWESIERRDDVLQGVINKRKKSVARLGWEVLTIEDSPEALAQKQALEYFYNHLTATHACDENQVGGFVLLVKQMMDAVAKKYAVHEIIYQPKEDPLGQKRLTANFRFVPLWFFQNREGRLKFMEQEHPLYGDGGKLLKAGEWLVTVADGLMEASSIAYLFKHLPLCDWLLYCERSGLPGVKGVTQAIPGSPEWELAKEALQDFSTEFAALISAGTDLQTIDLSTHGDLPYPALIERMDRAMIALWRGADLSTFSSDAHGASLQNTETSLLEDDDALHISEMLNVQVDRYVLEHVFGTVEPKAYVRLKVRDRADRMADLTLCQTLHAMGLPLSHADLRERFGLTTPDADEPVLAMI